MAYIQQPEPTDDPFSDSESGNSRPGSDTETDDDVIDDPIETEPIATLPETIDSLLPSETATSTSISASATSIDPPSPTLDAVQQARQQHHRNVETALTVVGTVCKICRPCLANR